MMLCDVCSLIDLRSELVLEEPSTLENGSISESNNISDRSNVYEESADDVRHAGSRFRRSWRGLRPSWRSFKVAWRSVADNLLRRKRQVRSLSLTSEPSPVKVSFCHHPSLDALRDSAAKGCQLCRLLYGGLADPRSPFDYTAHFQLPLRLRETPRSG